MFAVIMCGGSGTRFWPTSRRQRPKQFLDITGKGPMVVETCNRLSGLVSDEEIILVLGAEHLEEATDLFKGREIHMLAEPVGRNTAPCIGLGAIYAMHLGCNGAVAFLPADHFIANPSRFLKDLRMAGEIADAGGIVTLGIVPNRPETGYGYIRRGQGQIDVGGEPAYRVSKFVEKPDIEKARSYLTSGEYYWNGGIFVARPETILKEMAKQLPELYKGLQRLADVLGTERFGTELKDVYGALRGISFDYGIMENTREDVYVVPSECGWSDVGSWASLYELRTSERDRAQNLADGETLLIACENSFVSGNGGRLVACLGLKNILIVDTADAVLVADLNRSQDIREIVDRLKETGKDRLL
ncbi:MAG: NTP transferase domain-containing protein [Proteobacteria bacterium]|nr:NTP transferase domain-containing protein [Pseudomonadota bacterium]